MASVMAGPWETAFAPLGLLMGQGLLILGLSEDIALTTQSQDR